MLLHYAADVSNHDEIIVPGFICFVAMIWNKAKKQSLIYVAGKKLGILLL